MQDKIGPGDKLGALIGIDLKYQLIKETEGIPFDMAVDLGFDNTIINNKNVSEVIFLDDLAARSFRLTDRGYKLVPYGGLEMAAVYGSAIPENDTSIYVFAGLEWKLSQKFMFLLEFKGGDGKLGRIRHPVRVLRACGRVLAVAAKELPVAVPEAVTVLCLFSFQAIPDQCPSRTFCRCCRLASVSGTLTIRRDASRKVHSFQERPDHFRHVQ